METTGQAGAGVVGADVAVVAKRGGAVVDRAVAIVVDAVAGFRHAWMDARVRIIAIRAVGDVSRRDRAIAGGSGDRGAAVAVPVDVAINDQAAGAGAVDAGIYSLRGAAPHDHLRSRPNRDVIPARRRCVRPGGCRQPTIRRRIVTTAGTEV